MLINPFLLQAIEVITRAFLNSAYISTRDTTGVTSAVGQQLSTSGLETSGTDYAVFWQGTGDNSSTNNSDFLAELTDGTIRQNFNMEPQDATDAMSVGGMYPYTGVAARTWTLNYASDNNTAGIAGRSMSVLQLESGDLWSHTSGDVTGSAGNGAVVCSVTITTPGTYFIIASCVHSPGGNVAVFDGSTLYGELGVGNNSDGATNSPYWHVTRLTLTNETISIRALGTGTTVRQGSLLVMPASGFDKTYYAEQITTSATSAGSMTNALSNTFSISAPQNYHLLLASALINDSAVNNSVFNELFNETRGIRYNITQFREGNNAVEWYPTMIARVVQFSDNNPTISWRHYSEAGNTSTMKEMSIAILDLGIQGPPLLYLGTDTIINSTTLTLGQASTGDVVIAVSHSTSVSGLNIPTGYTSISNGTVGTLHYQISYKVMGSPADTEVAGLSSGNANIKHMALVFTGIDTGTPLDTTSVITSSTQNSNLVDPGSITTSNPSILVVIGILDDDNVAAAVIPPSGFSPAGTVEATGTIMAAYQIQTTAGTTDPDAFEVAPGSDQWVAATIALRRA